MKPKTKIISLAVTEEQFDKLKLRSPEYGDKSRLVRKLIVLFLDGKIDLSKLERKTA